MAYLPNINNNFFLDISKTSIAGTTYVSKFGQNADIGTGAFEDIWDLGGTYSYPDDGTATISHFDSSSASDTGQTIEIQGLDINGGLVVQTGTTNGTTLVALDTPLWRVFRMKNTGTYDIIGNVQCVNSGDSATYAQIQGNNNQTLMALYTIPSGKTGYMFRASASLTGLNRGYSVDGHIYMRSYGGVYQLKSTFGVDNAGSSNFEHLYPVPLKISAKTDIRVRAISSSAGGGLNATFDLILIDD